MDKSKVVESTTKAKETLLLGDFLIQDIPFGDYTVNAQKGKCTADGTATVIQKEDKSPVDPPRATLRPWPPPQPTKKKAEANFIRLALTIFEPGVTSDVPPPQMPSLASPPAGKAVDEKGNGVAGLHVVCSKLAEADPAPQQTETNEDGEFALDTPQEDGLYLLQFSRKGGSPVEFIVQVAKTTSPKVFHLNGEGADFNKLKVEEATTPPSPTISSSPQLTETSRRESYDAAAMLALPLAGFRSVDDLALLAPGVAPAPQTPGQRGPGIAPGIGTAGSFAVNGIRSRENNFNGDGQDDRDDMVGVRRQGFLGPTTQTIEAVEEFQIVTALADARWGRSLSAQVNTLSRHGTQRFHGSALGMFASDTLRAGSVFDRSVMDYPAALRAQVPVTADGNLPGTPGAIPVNLALSKSYTGPLTVNDGKAQTPNPLDDPNNLLQAQGSLSITGPLTPISQKLYGLFAAEGQFTDARERRNFIMPTFAQRGFSGNGATGFTSTGWGTLLTGGVGGAPGVIGGPGYPASLPGSAIFSLLPLPNNPLGVFGPNTFTQSLPSGGTARHWSGKLDLPDSKFGAGALRYNRLDDKSDLPAAGDAIYASIHPTAKVDSIAGSFTYFNSKVKSLSFETRGSWGRSSMNFDELRDPSLSDSALQGTPFLLNAPLLVNATIPNGKPPFGPTLASPETVLPFWGSITRTEQLTGALGQVQIAGFSPAGLDPFRFPQSRTDGTIQLGETAAYRTERHSTYAGIDAYLLHLNQFTDRNARPLALFGGMRSSGCCVLSSGIDGKYPDDSTLFSPLTMAAMGVPSGLYQTLATKPESELALHRNEIALFLQHFQRIGPRLHVNFGLRIDVASLPGKSQSERILDSYDTQRLASDVDTALAACAKLPGLVPTPPGANTGFGSMKVSDACARTANALQSILPEPLESVLNVRKPNFDYRGGLAWDVLGESRTVLRAGFGVYHGQFPAAIVDESRSSAPTWISMNLANFPKLGAYGLPVLFNVAGGNMPGDSTRVVKKDTLNQIFFPGQAVGAVASVVSVLATNLATAGPILTPTMPHAGLQGAYAFHGSLGLEHQIRQGLLLSAAYVGTLGRHLLRVATPDRGPGRNTFSPTEIWDGVDNLFPTFQGSVDTAATQRYARTLFQSDSSSSYHSLQLGLRGSLPRVRFGSSFTWSHSIDDASDFYDLSGAPALAANSARSSERASSNFDVRVRGTAFFVADLPRVKNRVITGWRLSGILTRQSGQPYTVNSVFDANSDGNLTDRPMVAPTSVRQGNRLLVAPAASSTTILGLTPAYLSTPAGQTGSMIGRNTYTLPAWNSVDLAAIKPIPLRGGQTLTARLELFNVLNSVSFAVPNRYLGSPAFGLSDRSVLAPRNLRLVLRFDF